MKKIILLLFAVAGAVSTLTAFTFTFQGGHVYTDVATDDVSAHDELIYPAFPPSATIDATDDTGNFSRTQISHTGSGDHVTLSFDFSQQRAGTPGLDFAGMSAGVSFSVSSAVSYTLSGYGVLSGFGYMTVELDDSSIPRVVAQNIQYGNGETITIGQLDEYAFGPLSGTLIPGHDYWVAFEAGTYPTGRNGDGGGTMTGNFTLTLNAVPESTSVLTLMGFSLLGLVATRRWFLR